jgi:hypothetical protein
MSVYRDDEIARRDAEAARASKRRLLAQVRVATPCMARWDAMEGDARVRSCGACQKDVYDLSAMTQTEAEDFVAEHTDGDACIRLYRRPDGTVMTSDCAEGRKVGLRKLKLGLGTVAAGAIALLTQFFSSAPKNEPRPFMGVMAPQNDPPRPASTSEAVYK